MTPDAEDLLLSKIVDREADLTDWDTLELWADEDPEIWKRLAEGLRVDCAVRASVAASEGGPILLPIEAPRRRWPVARIAAAAVIALLIATSYFAGRWQSKPTPERPDLGPSLPVNGLAGSEEGDGVELLPDVVVGRELGPDGQVDLVVLKRSLERRRVERVVHVGRDELGRLATTPAGSVIAPASF